MWKNQKSNSIRFNDIAIWGLTRYKDLNEPFSLWKCVYLFLSCFCSRKPMFIQRHCIFCYPVAEIFSSVHQERIYANNKFGMVCFHPCDCTQNCTRSAFYTTSTLIRPVFLLCFLLQQAPTSLPSCLKP